MSENTEIRFIKPCRRRDEAHRMLTPEYAELMNQLGRRVQINLDNCSLQRMEQLPANPTLDDVEEVGLRPLVDILQQAPIALTAIGLNEMPDVWVGGARDAYERFCAQFWPGHFNDVEATAREYDPNSLAKKVEFKHLNEGRRCTYGSAYVALLQIQNIRRTYQSWRPEQQFEIYLHSMITMLNMVSGFEVEIAKHVFWEVDANAINQLPKSVQSRLRDIKENFSKLQSSMQKCRQFAFNGAMDLHWLSGANLAEDLGLTIKIGSANLVVDNWVGTNDHKLYRISKDIHSVYHGGVSMKRVAITREPELGAVEYWKEVDRMTNDILGYRLRTGYTPLDDLLPRIDRSVALIEDDLVKIFSPLAVA